MHLPSWNGAAAAVVLLSLFLFAPFARCVEPSVQEYQIKAAFLYNFAKFIEWPGEAGRRDAPLYIVVFSRDDFGAVLEHVVQGKTIDERPLVVRRAARREEIRPCHVLFLAGAEGRQLSEVLPAGGPILTVGEDQDFLPRGGIIRFVMENNRVRFEINMKVARERGLKISSKLLGLAKAVWE